MKYISTQHSSIIKVLETAVVLFDFYCTDKWKWVYETVSFPELRMGKVKT